MVPFYLFVGSLPVLRGAGALGVPTLGSWRAATRAALSLMFLFTGVTHFTAMASDYAAMIPPPLPQATWLVHGTGVLEIAGAVGLWIPRLRRPAGIGLVLLLVAVFPANIHAALAEIPFRGRPATPLWLRTPVQAVFLAAALWGAALRPAAREESESR